MRKITSIVMIILTMFLVLCLNSCARNSLKINMGTDEDNSVSLNLNGEKEVIQDKIKIKQNEIEFNKQKSAFQNLNLYFSGNNIKNIEIVDDNETMIFDDKNKLVMGIDFLSFFTKVDESILKKSLSPQGDDTSYTLDTRRLGESCWDSGCFEDVKFSFANNQDYYNLNRVRKTETNDYAFSFGEGTPFEDYQMNFSLDSDTDYKIKNVTAKSVHYLNTEYTVSEPFCSFSVYFNSYEKKRNAQGITEILMFDKDTRVDYEEDNNCVRWLYEKLFYGAYKAEKLKYNEVSDNAVVTVNYTDSTREKYKLEFRFNNKGNVIVKGKK